MSASEAAEGAISVIDGVELALLHWERYRFAESVAQGLYMDYMGMKSELTPEELSDLRWRQETGNQLGKGGSC